MNTKVRNLCFDQVKGVLIILVIVGHVALGSLDKNWLRSVIYFFHMPLFLAVTGYFIKPSLLNLSAKDIVKKYQTRLIVPFLLAAVIYYALMAYQQSLTAVLKTIVPFYPYYHLWYVPAVLIFIFYLKFLYKKNRALLYGLSLLFVIATIYFEAHVQWQLSEHFIYYWLGDKRFYYFFSYFAFGFLLSIHQEKLSNWQVYFIALLCVSLGVFYWTDNVYVLGLGKFLANMSIIALVIYLCQKQKMPISPLLVKIGKVSLTIYLWHVFILLLLQNVLLQKLALSANRYYGISAVVFMVFVALVIYFEDKNAIINRLFYGKVGQ